MKQEIFSFVTNDPRNSYVFDDVKPNIMAKFWEYHEENPHVYELLVKYTKQVKDSGRKRFSIAAVFERIRWHSQIETKGDEFKLNNSYCSPYARLVMLLNPSFEGIFQTRETPRKQ